MFSLRTQNAFVLAVAGFVLWTASGAVARAELLRTGGTGAAQETLRRLAAAFSKVEPEIRIEVIEGLGSSGAIAAVAGGAIDFAISGRPLGANDSRALKGSVIARTPFCLASSHPQPGDVRSVDIADFIGSATSVWSDGKPVRLILRPRSDSDSQLLVRYFPEMAAAMDKARQRSEIPVAATDRDNAMLAENMAGSLTAITFAQIQTENPSLTLLSIDGVTPTLENFESGKYPYGKDLELVVPSNAKPALERFVAFVRSSGGREVLRANGSLPVQP
jgi:phosphate transport system substrate-binding protein